MFLLLLVSLVSYHANSQYCTGGPSSTFDSNVQSVSLMGQSTSISYTGCSPAITGLEDQTSQVADLMIGGSYNVDVAWGTCGGTYSNAATVYIDFNGDQTFDASEVVGTWSGTPPTTVQTYNFTVPGTAVPGVHRMRVQQQEGGTLPLNPCATFTWGSMTDFGIQINSPGGCIPPSFYQAVNITASSADLAWTESNGVEWIVEWGPQGFIPGTGTVIYSAVNSTSISGLSANTNYSAYFASICDNGDTSYYSGPLNFSTSPFLLPYMAWDTACPPSGFIDISGTGTATNLSDDGEVGVTLGFPFPFQGTTVNTLTIGNNGGIEFNTLTANIALGGVVGPTTNSGLYPWWDDIDSDEGNVYYETIGTTPNQIFIVQWDQRPHFSGVIGQNITFEIQMYETTGEIYFVYDDVIFGGTQAGEDYAATAGIGLAGPVQDFAVSSNDTNYLLNNTCVHFFNDSCTGTITSSGPLAACSGDTVDLFTNLTGYSGGGFWTEEMPSNTMNEPLVYSGGLIDTVYNYYYIESGTGCVLQEVEVASAHAGEDSILLACPEDFINLFDGLGGDFDTTNGVWYDPSQFALPGSTIMAPSFPGLYNYDYIQTNGLCSDTSTIVVDLISDCPDWGLGELDIENIALYPNPIVDDLTIMNNGVNNYQFLIYDIQGKVLYQSAQDLQALSSQLVSMGYFDQGIYFVKVYNEYGEHTFKVVKH